MNVDIFSDCMFTRSAFEYLVHQLNPDVDIAVFDVGLYLDNYYDRFSEEGYAFIFVLNTRKNPPVAVSNKVIVLSKFTPLPIMINIINLCLFNRCEFVRIMLTSREYLCCKYWLEGGTTAAIASKMNESIKTVSNIKQSIYRKYNISDLYTFMLITKVSQMNGSVHCHHYKLFDGVKIINHPLERVKNAQFDGSAHVKMHIDFYSSA